MSELSNVDIAGALGMVREKLGRAVLEATAWDRDAPGVLHTLRTVLQSRIVERMREINSAMQDAAIVELLSDDEDEIRHARQRADRLRDLALPARVESIHRVLDLVLCELYRPNHCPVCAGRGQFRTDALVVTCAHCGASGRCRVTDEDRAAALDMSLSGYRKSREKVLRDWLAGMLSELARTAERELQAAIER